VIQIRAGFFNRSAKVVFFTLFGVFWLLLGVPILVFVARARSAANDPAAKDRLERMKQEFQREQAERENKSR
jgi:MFS-type transporter involved in bile tolerance (Atg22 family)